jgi:hypothetical protein
MELVRLNYPKVHKKKSLPQPKEKEKSVSLRSIVATLALGSQPKAKAYKGAGQEGSPRVTSHAPMSVGECEGKNFHTPKCGVGVPMDFRMECRYIKWVRMTHLDT